MKALKEFRNYIYGVRIVTAQEGTKVLGKYRRKIR